MAKKTAHIAKIEKVVCRDELLLDIQRRLMRIEEMLTGPCVKVKVNPKFVRKGDFRESKRQAIREAVEACGGNKTMACYSLGISRATLYRALKEEEQ